MAEDLYLNCEPATHDNNSIGSKNCLNIGIYNYVTVFVEQCNLWAHIFPTDLNHTGMMTDPDLLQSPCSNSVHDLLFSMSRGKLKAEH
jgi:hypothetical protein